MRNLIVDKQSSARLIGVMLTHGVTHLLTFNIDDFTNTAGIVVVHPQTVIDSP
ncbi:MAG: hypothetical protein V7K14_09430 [Nostoc sp.]|uniref:hypothetical protein n=1 Tax=Nostoc sp. TaxID=1180 RepID=UPI002FFC24EB